MGKFHILPLGFILIIACVHGQLPNLPQTGLLDGGKPMCNINVIMPCLNEAIKSYSRNTRGPEAANMPLNPMDSQIVAAAIGVDLGDPKTDFNGTCEIIKLVEVEKLSACLKDATQDCSVEVPKGFQVEKEQLPSFSGLSVEGIGDTVRLLCNDECLLFPVLENVVKMKACWKDNEDALALAQDNMSNTTETCSAVESYMLCQWTYSIGCPFLEDVTRRYLRELESIIIRCEMMLPPEALTEALVTTSGSNQLQLLTLQTLLLVPLLQLMKDI